MQRISPFIMLDYNSTHKFLPSDKPKGIGVHPHKDLETVIIAYKDKVANHDNSQMCITQRIPRRGME
ncbi:pirin family protein [Mesonia sp. MT50]|uniref:Pirin family protein n=1 Tax=Mesonia profundi TaxID=3070998 RepID=A0ABU0ZYF0_9FLAO|nr:pirin family protein [Mesonia profundi]MDQ7916490.1 pirin family protein [Mesonia profundi]